MFLQSVQAADSAIHTCHYGDILVTMVALSIFRLML